MKHPKTHLETVQRATRATPDTARGEPADGRGIARVPPPYGIALVDRAPEAGRPLATAGLPDPLRSGVAQLSGMSVDDVRVHYNSPEPARIQALAYTRGNEIHVGPGQEEHLPHEAWHAVQQKQGRVAPTGQLGGRAVNTSAALEQEADVMGARAARGRAASSRAPGDRRDPPAAHEAVAQRRTEPVIQARKVQLHQGARKRVLYPSDRYTSEGGKSYLDLNLDNYPHINVIALKNYEKSVERNPSGPLSFQDVYEKTVHSNKVCKFGPDDAMRSFHITHGDRIVSAATNPSKIVGLQFAQLEAEHILEGAGSGEMGEEDAQHVSTHVPGGGSNLHRHYVAAGKVDLQVVERYVDCLEDYGLIGQPRVNRNRELVKTDASKPDSLDVGRAVRARLGLPDRRKPLRKFKPSTSKPPPRLIDVADKPAKVFGEERKAENAIWKSPDMAAWLQKQGKVEKTGRSWKIFDAQTDLDEALRLIEAFKAAEPRKAAVIIKAAEDGAS